MPDSWGPSSITPGNTALAMHQPHSSEHMLQVDKDKVQEGELTEDKEEDKEEEDKEGERRGTRLWGIDIGNDELMAEAEEVTLAYEYQLHGNDDNSHVLIRDLCGDDDESSESHSRVEDDQLPFICTSAAKRLKF
ncbi:hypothetical protein PAXRUDRAFT_147691 [Paxillus rubicundulus Ve08.2h10]|uniref:Uncharacterized protein n=1 Tax=Paxillus rubicundulus Ve08.2h10 TaxID=930991 RepID=A0A0D0E4N3_9AGAM|nr:hypothetical protein PAXRUDRAFT_147691 [Paxillus rubicundulus Ve08.2h10]